MGFSYRSESPEETFRAGETIGKLALPGLVVALSGNLGAGKTLLTKGIAKGLGVPNYKYVSSPTFTIHKVYKGRLTLNHFDFYRLEGDSDPIEAGLEEMLESDGISVIEWPDQYLSQLGQDVLLLEITPVSESGRNIVFSWRGEISASVGERLARALGVTEERS